MDRANFELLATIRLADLYREADAARLREAIPRRPLLPTLLPSLGSLLIRAGHWLQQFGPVCPDCPAPALP